jgi:hypothetical protein
MSAWWPSVLRLAALVTCAGLATSRLGLVVHELVGHGGATLAVGGEVTSVKLFYLAGGWIRFRATQGHLAIALGGIAVETVVGVALFLIARGDSLGRRILRAIGCALVIHASWYLATGTWHGYGDGVELHRMLGDDTWLVAIPAAAVTLAASYTGARTVLPSLAATLPRARVAGAALALVISGVVQLGGALGEVALRRDAAYSAVMKPERDRRIASELRQWEQRQVRPPSAEERVAIERALAAKHRKAFPFAVVLAILTGAAILAGAFRGRGVAAGEVPPGLLVRAASWAAGSIALVIAIDVAFL